MGYEADNDALNNTAAAVDAGMALGDVKVIVNDEANSPLVVGVVVPKGANLKEFDLEKHALQPRRKKGNVNFATVDSFSAWVNRNKTPETIIYAKEATTTFLAIFNGHAANVQATQPAGPAEGAAFSLGAPGWADFTATYGCPLSEEWKRWHGASQHDKGVDNKGAMKHADFIQFIEDNLLDITTPDNGAMLAAVRAFEAKRDVKFASARRLDNGDVSFAYAEDTQQQVPAGTLALPSKFTITIPVFKDGTAYQIDANLRYRVTAGGLFLWYELIRPHKSLEHAFQQVALKIGADTGVPMFST